MNILSIDEASKFASGKTVVIITGVTGQDGSFMADYLLKNTDHEIFGGARRLSVANHENIDHLRDNPRFHLINFDLTDAHSINHIISQLKPNYFINFAAQSFVKSSWDFPAQTWDTNTTSIIHILEAIRLYAPACRFYNAGSSEEFGDVAYTPQDEKHPMRPRSPYGASKAAARQIVKVYRDSYGLYAIQGWLFNHEGTRRGEEFVTRKITKAVARIYNAIQLHEEIIPLELGNIDVRRDWSDAEDMVDAVWRMLNQEIYNSSHLGWAVIKGWNVDEKLLNTYVKYGSLKEYVVSSNETHTVREFVENAFNHMRLKGHWEGSGHDEQYVLDNYDINLGDGQPGVGLPTIKVCLVKINPSFYRPAEVDTLLGDSTAIREELKWNPQIHFDALVGRMVHRDVFNQ